jgi:hypothetical protein
MLGAALNVRVTPVEVKEIAYQAVPYVGFDFYDDTLNGWLRTPAKKQHSKSSVFAVRM